MLHMAQITLTPVNWLTAGFWVSLGQYGAAVFAQRPWLCVLRALIPGRLDASSSQQPWIWEASAGFVQEASNFKQNDVLREKKAAPGRILHYIWLTEDTLVLSKTAVNGQRSHLLAWGAFCWCRTTCVGLLCAAGTIDIAYLLSLSSVLPPSVIQGAHRDRPHCCSQRYFPGDSLAAWPGHGSFHSQFYKAFALDRRLPLAAARTAAVIWHLFLNILDWLKTQNNKMICSLAAWSNNRLNHEVTAHINSFCMSL